MPSKTYSSSAASSYSSQPPGLRLIHILTGPRGGSGGGGGAGSANGIQSLSLRSLNRDEDGLSVVLDELRDLARDAVQVWISVIGEGGD